MQQAPLTENLAGHFRQANDFRTRIYQLQSAWDSLALLAQLSGTGTEMDQTRRAFNTLSADVLQHLSQETLHKVAAQLSSKAMVTINLLVRNLFERTADIGFFATDDVLRDYLQQVQAGTITPPQQATLALRFAEYQKKYTVYDNIALFDLHGRLLHQLDDRHTRLTDQHPIVALAYPSSAPYIERFYPAGTEGHATPALLYAHTIVSQDGRTPLGVLCLSFKFMDELATIFRHLLPAGDWAVGVLLDDQQRVIASSDPYQIPPGAPVCAEPGQDWFIGRFAGREYLCVTRQSAGYQGYLGPGWLAQAMIPLEHAFQDNARALAEHIDHTLLQKVMRSPLIFSESLLNIPKQAASIQSTLNQSVWNGNLWQRHSLDAQQKNFSKTLLGEISQTGHQTQQVIEHMVAELYQTVVSTMLQHSSVCAQLAVDILDRNLYERANDVRWWALTDSFRTLLAQPALTADDQQLMTEILQYIHRLYTVYDNLLLFDTQGKIVAVSSTRHAHLVNTTLQAEWVARCRSCQDNQAYVVSRFEPTALYDHDYTYIYATPVRHPDGQSQVGGIAIVFDSRPQLQAMLTDVMPRDRADTPIAGSFTLFVDSQCQVLASTHADIATGDHFSLLPAISQLQAGQALFDIVTYQQTYYGVGAHAAYGYREFTGASHPASHTVVSLIFTPLGEVESINQRIRAEAQRIHNKFNPNLLVHTGQQALSEYATFYVGGSWLGIETESVLEASHETRLRHLPQSASCIAGMHAYHDSVIPVIDLACMLGHTDYMTDHRQLVVIEDKVNLRKFGILVSALGEIPYLSAAHIQPMHTLFNGSRPHPGVAIAHVAQTPAPSAMLTLVTPQSLWETALALREAQPLSGTIV